MMKHFFKYHFEWIALLTGLVLMGLMNPHVDNGVSFCLFEMANLNFCPGEGVGHSIAYTFRGELGEAVQAHPFGPAAVLILSGRIFYLWKRVFIRNKNNSEEL